MRSCSSLLAVLMGVVILAPGQVDAAVHSIEVRAVRLWAGPDGTRVVLDLSGSATHSLMTLSNPDRLVIDIGGANLGPGAHTTREGMGVVRQVRLGRRAGEVRVVLDLAHATQAKSFLAEPNDRYGYRLVVDLAGAQAAPAAAETPVKVEHSPASARDLVIAVDAGHGGEDPGAIGKHGTREKDVVLAIARELAQRINAEPGMRAVLTRTEPKRAISRSRSSGLVGALRSYSAQSSRGTIHMISNSLPSGSTP